MAEIRRIGVIGSTAGSVFIEAYERSSAVRERTNVVISDRECGLVSFARARGIPTFRVNGASNEAVSDEFLAVLRAQSTDLIVSFYTRLFRGAILTAYEGRFANFHPSLLPRHPGMRGFEDSIRSRDDYIGSTVHLVDEGVDTGRILMQSSILNHPTAPLAERRHMVFLLQVCQLVLLCEQPDAVLSQLGSPGDGERARP